MQVYHIPTNFKDAGYVFNGMIAVRNAIDAVVMGLIGFLFASLLPFDKEKSISGYILIVGVFAMIGFFGIRDIPVSTFIADALRWRGRRKPFLYNHHGTSYSMTAAELMLTEPQLRNKIADMLDKVQESMASKRIEYIEGETFRFAEDPELEALRYAEEQMQGGDNKEDTLEDAIPAEKEEKAVDPKAVDFDQIIDNIVLSDIEEK